MNWLVGRLRDVTIMDRDASGEMRVITARDLRLSDSGQQTGVITLRLNDAFTHISGPGRGDFEYISADVMDYQIVLPEIVEALVDIGPGEQSSRDVWRSITELRANWQRQRDRVRSGLAYALLADLSVVTDGSADAAPDQRAAWLDRQRERLNNRLRSLMDADQARLDRELRNHLFEFHKKLAVPTGCLVFTLFAIPAGLPRAAQRARLRFAGRHGGAGALLGAAGVCSQRRASAFGCLLGLQCGRRTWSCWRWR